MRRLLSARAEAKLALDAITAERARLALGRVLGAAAIAVLLIVATAGGAHAQTGAEYGHTISGGGVPGGDYHPSMPSGAPINAPAPSGSGPSATVMVPPGPSREATGAPVHTNATHHHHAAANPDEYALLEPAEGRLKLISDSWSYERPTKASKRVEAVQAGKFVNVIGTSPNFVQVKLKNSEIAYVPIAAVQLVTPSDKLFQLTNDAAVRRAPNQAAKKVAEVHKGHPVHVIGLALNYMKIRMKDGVEGFIPISALE